MAQDVLMHPRATMVPRAALPLAAVALLGAVILARQWAAPYPLPSLPPGLTVARVGLSFERERATISAARGAPRAPGDSAYRRAVALLAADHPDEAIRILEEAIRLEPRNLAYGNTLRRALADRQRWQDLVGIWDRFDPSVREIRLQKTLALVDAMADPQLADAGIGRLSVRSMRESSALLAHDEYDWLARYARGLNNLYWPVSLRRMDKAIADLGFCAAVVEALDLRDAWLAIGHAAYGDALIKTGRIDEGVRVWQAGLARFPASRALRERVAAGGAGAVALVRRERGMDAIQRPSAGVADLTLIWSTLVPSGQEENP